MRAFYSGFLASLEFGAFRWETPPISLDNAGVPFEFVVLDDPRLIRKVDVSAFAAYFQPARDVVSFNNLGGDATLVVPCPRGPEETYCHLASFLRGAPAEQCDELWRMVGEAMVRRVGEQPVWLSTAGMGVPWLHVRLDSRPKYYGYRPYTAV